MSNKHLITDVKNDGLEEAKVVEVLIERKKRLPYKKFVSYGPEYPPRFNAIASNISETGLHLQTNLLANNTFDPGTPLSMTINVGMKNYKCEGVVTWTKTVAATKTPYKKYCMGIKFTKVSKELLKYCKDLIFSGYSCLDSED